MIKIAADYRRAAVRAMIQHGVVLILAALILDGGGILRACLIAVLAHWAAILVIVARRPTRPTGLDIVMVRYGFWAMAIATMLIVPIIYRLKGVS